MLRDYDVITFVTNLNAQKIKRANASESKIRPESVNNTINDYSVVPSETTPS